MVKESTHADTEREPRPGTIGFRVKQERLARNWSQTQLGRAAGGLKQQTVSHIERNNIKKPRDLVMIAEAFGVYPYWLRTGEGEKVPPAWDTVIDLEDLPRETQASVQGLLNALKRGQISGRRFEAMVALLLDNDDSL